MHACEIVESDVAGRQVCQNQHRLDHISVVHNRVNLNLWWACPLSSWIGDHIGDYRYHDTCQDMDPLYVQSSGFKRVKGEKPQRGRTSQQTHLKHHATSQPPHSTCTGWLVLLSPCNTVRVQYSTYTLRTHCNRCFGSWVLLGFFCLVRVSHRLFSFTFTFTQQPSRGPSRWPAQYTIDSLVFSSTLAIGQACGTCLKALDGDGDSAP